MVRATYQVPRRAAGAVNGTEHPRVELRRVTSGYVRGRPVVTDLSVTVPGPGVVQVTGPNGTGKSTVVELLSGYLRPWQGSVTVCGEPAHSDGARSRRRVCRTKPALFTQMTVRDHLVLSARATGADPGRQLARGDAFGLAPWLDENAGVLSSGSAKKLWYLVCTAGDFDVVVLDEPYNALDVDSAALMSEELDAWGHEATVMLVCHTPPPNLVIPSIVELSPRTAARL